MAQRIVNLIRTFNNHKYFIALGAGKIFHDFQMLQYNNIFFKKRYELLDEREIIRLLSPL